MGTELRVRTSSTDLEYVYLSIYSRIYLDRYMEINLLKAMNHPNIVNHPQRVPWAQRALGPGRRWARGPGATYGGPRRPGPRALWAHGALWGWLTMFGWFIAFSKLISIYLSRYILLYLDGYTYFAPRLTGSQVKPESPYIYPDISCYI